MRPVGAARLAWSFGIGLTLVAGACGAAAAADPEPAASPTPRAAPGPASRQEGGGASLDRATEATPRPSPTSPPQPSPTPDPSPVPTTTPTPGVRLVRLTEGGCCVQPFWSPQGDEVRFLDRPAADAPVGVYGVGMQGGEARLVTQRLGSASPDGRYVLYPEGGQTYIEDLTDGRRWPSPSGQQPAAFTPDGAHVWWQETVRDSQEFSLRVVDVWMAHPDGAEARRLARLTGGGVSDWFPSGERLLVSSREGPQRESVLSVLDLLDGSSLELARALRIRNATLSRDGRWVAYQVTFSEDPSLDGMWLVSADGSLSRRLEIFGAYRWRPGGGLLVVPLEADPATGSQRFLQVDPATGDDVALTDPAETPFRIADGDWTVSPDGRRIAFVSAEDRNVWVVELPVRGEAGRGQPDG